MKRAVYYAAASLDGYIADPDDGLDWLTGYEGSSEAGDGEPGPMSEGGGYERFYEGVGSLVMGSVTYEWILDHLDIAGGGGEWPYKGKPCWVLSSRELRVPEGDGVDVRIRAASPEEIYEDVVASAGDRAVWIVGGGNVASQFARAGLIEELILTVVPVVLGDGKPLFDEPPRDPFVLLGTRAFQTGMVELRYRLAG